MKYIKTIFILIFMITLTGCSSSENIDMNEKLNIEIEYLDSAIIKMLNDLNNISTTNYLINTKEITIQSSSSSENSSGQTSGESQTDGGSEQKVEVTEIANNGILNTDKEPKWDEIKQDIEKMYSSWNTIVLDLYSLNVPTEDIQKFSKLLDISTLYIKDENKLESIKNLTELYKSMTLYSKYISGNEIKTEILRTKYYILKSYELIEENKWEEMLTQLDLANDSFVTVLNNEEFKTKNELTLNKIYIQLEDLNNSIITKDKDIFYIKYKNFIEEINSLEP